MAFGSEDLAHIRWTGEATYRVLSYYFSLRWNHPVGDYIHDLLDVFCVPPDPAETRTPPTPGLPSSYSVLDLGAGQQDRYALLYGGAPLIRSADVSDVIHHFMWHVNSEAVRHTGDFLLIHAGAISTPDGAGILLPAGTGSGKTTLVAALLRAGFDYLSDEAGAIDPVSRKLYPYPKALTLKRGSFDLFAELRPASNVARFAENQWHVRPRDIGSGGIGGPCDISIVVSISYREGAATEMTEMSAAAAVHELARSAMNLSFYRARALLLLAEVARRATNYRLVSGDLDGAVAAITKAAEALEDR